MPHPQPDTQTAGVWRLDIRSFLAREWPYLLVLTLALFGVAYTSFSGTPIAKYWIVLAPIIGVICVITRWPAAKGREQRLHLIWTQTAHWAAVLVAMRLTFVADVSRMMTADTSALVALTVLALGTFTAGVHIAALRICLIGIVLAVGVPAIAWLEQSALVILLIAVVLLAVAAPFLWPRLRQLLPSTVFGPNPRRTTM
jgi:hypothetical protein